MDDKTFFGPAFAQVQKLRAAIHAGQANADDAAKAVIQVSNLLVGPDMPPAVELITNGHIDLLCERLFPDPNFTSVVRTAVADTIRVYIREAQAAAAGGEGSLTVGA